VKAFTSVAVAGLVGFVSPSVVAVSAAARQRDDIKAAEKRLREQLDQDRFLSDLAVARERQDEAVDQGEAALSALFSAQAHLREPDAESAAEQLAFAGEALGICGYKTRRLMLFTGRFDDMPMFLDGYADALRALQRDLNLALDQGRPLDGETWQKHTGAIAQAHAALIDHSTDVVGVKLNSEPTLSDEDVASILGAGWSRRR